jgi:D-alanyl-D-alanine carboxypeptidase
MVGISKRYFSAVFGRAVALVLVLVIAGVAVPYSDALAAKRRSGSGTPSVAAAIVVDMNTGIILHSQAPDTPRYPASLTKMMTLYVLFSCLKDGKITLSSDLVVTAHAESQAPTKLGLKQGTTIKVEDAIKALVTQSANDAAVTIAENLAGTEENFARYMTQTARNIGMTNTTFRNASGLPDDEQITTARDMATLATHLIHDYPQYYGVFETRYFTYAGRKYRNHNRLLFGYKGTDGIKTGYTRASGFNLTASVHRGNKHLVAVVLGGKTGSQRDAAMRALLDKNFVEASDTKPTKEQLVAALVSPSGARTPAPVPQVAKPAAPAPAPDVVEAAAPTPVPQVVKPAPAAKPAPTSAEAELETFVSPAKANKPSFSLASVAPEPSTVGTPNDYGQGDTGEPSVSANDAALPWRAEQKKLAKQKYAGAFHVQVGAYTSESEAESRLGVVQQRAADLLDGHLPFTTSFTKEGAEWYRARFAGFSRGDAQSACEALKKMSVDCVVMKAE